MSQCKAQRQRGKVVLFCVRQSGHAPPHQDDSGKIGTGWVLPEPKAPRKKKPRGSAGR